MYVIVILLCLIIKNHTQLLINMANTISKDLKSLLSDDQSFYYDINFTLSYENVNDNKNEQISITIKDLISFEHSLSIENLIDTMTIRLPHNFEIVDKRNQKNYTSNVNTISDNIKSFEDFFKYLKVYKIVGKTTSGKYKREGCTCKLYIKISKTNDFDYSNKGQTAEDNLFYFEGFLTEVNLNYPIELKFQGPMSLLAQNYVLFPIVDKSKNKLANNKNINDNSFSKLISTGKIKKHTDILVYQMKLFDYINEVLLYGTQFYNRLYCDLDTTILIKQTDCSTLEALSQLKDLFPGLYIYFFGQTIEETFLCVTNESGLNKIPTKNINTNSINVNDIPLYVDKFVFSDKNYNSDVNINQINFNIEQLKKYVNNNRQVVYSDDFGYVTNIDNLYWKDKDNIQYVVKATSYNLKTGETVSVIYPKIQDESIHYSTLNLFNGDNMDEKQLTEWAKLNADKYKYTGYQGSFETPLTSQNYITNIVYLLNLGRDNNQNPGFYLLRGIDTICDNNSLKQKLTLGSKIS